MPISSQLASSRLIQPGVCTSSTRPVSPFEGQVIYETDTDRTLFWNGSAWYANWNTAWGVVAYNISNTGDTTISSEEVQITGSAFTAVANRLYKITYYEPDLYSLAGSNGYIAMRVRQTNISGTVYAHAYTQVETPGVTNRIGIIVWLGTLPAGSINFVATLAYSSTTGAAARSGDTRAYLIVEDVGPA